MTINNQVYINSTETIKGTIIVEREACVVVIKG